MQTLTASNFRCFSEIMFASFYNIWKRAGRDSVKDSQDYVYGNTASTGERRLATPEHIAGVDRQTMEILGRDCAFTGKYLTTVGSLNFEEQPPTSVLIEIFRDFVDFSFAGIDRSKRCVSGVRHLKELKLTGEVSADVHFMNLPVLLGCGRIFRPYYWRGSRYGYELWAERMNYAHGFSSPFDPARRRVTTPRIYASDTPEIVEYKRDVGALVKAAWDNRELSSGRDVIDLLMAQPGVTKVAHNKYGITAMVGGIKRPVTLTAMLFAEGFNAEYVREKVDRLRRRSKEEVEREFKRVLQLRADEHFRRFGRTTVGWTYCDINKLLIKKETNYVLPLFTNQGRAWAAALDVDHHAAKEFRRLGAACDDLERRVRKINPESGASLTVSESIVTGGGGSEGLIDRFDRSAGALRKIIDRAFERFSRPKPPHTIARNPGEIGGVIAALDRAAQHIAHKRVAYPNSATEVEEALERFYLGKTITDRERNWLMPSFHGVKPAVLKALERTDPAGCRVLIETIEILSKITLDHGDRDVSVER